MWIGPLLSFVTVTSYVMLHKVARALEDPFVHPPNDLPANALQARTMIGAAPGPVGPHHFYGRR